MNTNNIATPYWSTSAFGNQTDSLPMQSKHLSAHLTLCNKAYGSLSAMQSVAEIAHGFIVSRFVTTLTVVALLIGVCSLVI